MGKKSNSDYIPTEGEMVAKHEATVEYMRTHISPLNKYKVSYSIYSKPQDPMIICAYDTKEAIQILKDDCSKVGWIPLDITIELIEASPTNPCNK